MKDGAKRRFVAGNQLATAHSFQSKSHSGLEASSHSTPHPTPVLPPTLGDTCRRTSFNSTLGTLQVPGYLLRKDVIIYVLITPLMLSTLYFKQLQAAVTKEYWAQSSHGRMTPHCLLQSVRLCLESSMQTHLAFQTSTLASSSFFILSFPFISIYLLILIMYTEIYKRHLLKWEKKPLKISSHVQAILLNFF